MPDVRIDRHGDRWAVALAGDSIPVFESYTRAEAEAEARRRAEGGEVLLVDGPDAGPDAPQWLGRPDADQEVDVRQPEDLRPGGESARPGEELREPQAGL
jgi:hypothetical protein